MMVTMRREVSPIKNGYRSHCPALRFAAHGSSPELADINLTRTVLLFLTSFERAGTLRDEARALGLGEVERMDDVQIALSDL